MTNLSEISKNILLLNSYFIQYERNKSNLTTTSIYYKTKSIIFKKENK